MTWRCLPADSHAPALIRTLLHRFPPSSQALAMLRYTGAADRVGWSNILPVALEVDALAGAIVVEPPAEPVLTLV